MPSEHEGYGLQPVHQSSKIRWSSVPEGIFLQTKTQPVHRTLRARRMNSRTRA